MKKLLAICCLAAMTFGVANAQISYGTKAGADFSKWTISAQGAGLSISTSFNTGFYLGGSAILPVNDLISLQGDLLYSYSGATVSAGKKLMDSDLLKDSPVGGKRLAVNVNTSSINIPIVAKFGFDNFSVLAGPYIKYRFAANVRANGNLEDYLKEMIADENSDLEPGDPEISYDDIEEALGDLFNDNLRKVEFGLNFGAEYAFECGLYIDARYAFSINNLLKYDDIDLSGLSKVMDGASMPKGIDLEDMTSGIVPTIKAQSFRIGLGYRF